MNYNTNRMCGICPTCKRTIWCNPRNPSEKCPVCHKRYNTQYAIGYYNSVFRNNPNNLNNINAQNVNNQVNRSSNQYNNQNIPQPIIQQQKTSLIPAICPQCHGQIQINSSDETATCQFCGTNFLVDKAVNNFYNIRTTNIHNQAKKGIVESVLYYKNQEKERMYRDSERNRERLHELISDPKKLRNFIIFLCVIFGIPLLLFLIPALII